MRPGLLIIFEGIDGTGKTTQLSMLADKLRAMGFEVVTTREPTDGEYGQRIRQLYANRSSVDPSQELSLFMEDRRQHVREVINPALAAGKIVLSDRYYLSTAAYQGAVGHDPREIIRLNEEFAPRPDLVLHLVVPISVGIHRIMKLRRESLNDFEKEESLKKVAAVFDELEYDYIVRIDAEQDADQVHGCIMDKVMALIREKGMTGRQDVAIPSSY